MLEAQIAANELVAADDEEAEGSDISDPELGDADSEHRSQDEAEEEGDEDQAPGTPGAGALDSDEELPQSQEIRLDEDELPSSSYSSKSEDVDGDPLDAEDESADKASLSSAVQEGQEAVRNSSPDEFDPLFHLRCCVSAVEMSASS